MSNDQERAGASGFLPPSQPQLEVNAIVIVRAPGHRYDGSPGKIMTAEAGSPFAVYGVRMADGCGIVFSERELEKTQ